MPMFAKTSFVLLVYFLLAEPRPSTGGTYEDKKAIHDTFLAPSVYNPDIRPVKNQSDVLYINVHFELVTIVEINDVVQSFQCNGFLAMMWIDEKVTWSASDYGGETVISPKPKDVFRPRMVLLNTMDKRDLFEDDAAPMKVFHSGATSWAPGTIFPASCSLNMRKYPYDEQTCGIQMLVMSYTATELQFAPLHDSTGLTFFTENGEWEIVYSNVTTPFVNIDDHLTPSILVTFHLKRKPFNLIISILLPIVFLSFLNLMVFVIPVDSGEKISYGITVLLALSVFMSIMSEMLPRSAERIPLIVLYIFILMTNSVLTVVASIVVVRLHHMEEKKEESIKASPSPIDDEVPVQESIYKVIGKLLDKICLLVFGSTWVVVSLAFMLSMALQS